jgi:hypothetical protein
VPPRRRVPRGWRSACTAARPSQCGSSRADAVGEAEERRNWRVRSLDRGGHGWVLLCTVALDGRPVALSCISAWLSSPSSLLARGRVSSRGYITIEAHSMGVAICHRSLSSLRVSPRSIAGARVTPFDEPSNGRMTPYRESPPARGTVRYIHRSGGALTTSSALALCTPSPLPSWGRYLAATRALQTRAGGRAAVCRFTACSPVYRHCLRLLSPTELTLTLTPTRDGRRALATCPAGRPRHSCQRYCGDCHARHAPETQPFALRLGRSEMP